LQPGGRRTTHSDDQRTEDVVAFSEEEFLSADLGTLLLWMTAFGTKTKKVSRHSHKFHFMTFDTLVGQYLFKNGKKPRHLSQPHTPRRPYAPRLHMHTGQLVIATNPSL
jgi:hypothetical protein